MFKWGSPPTEDLVISEQGTHGNLGESIQLPGARKGPEAYYLTPDSENMNLADWVPRPPSHGFQFSPRTKREEKIPPMPHRPPHGEAAPSSTNYTLLSQQAA